MYIVFNSDFLDIKIKLKNNFIRSINRILFYNIWGSSFGDTNWFFNENLQVLVQLSNNY